MDLRRISISENRKKEALTEGKGLEISGQGDYNFIWQSAEYAGLNNRAIKQQAKRRGKYGIIRFV